MDILKLVIPTKQNEEQVLNFKEEFIKNNDRSFDGCEA